MLPRLEEKDAALCEGMVSLEERTSALKKMMTGSAPGSDGVTVKFMKFIWAKIGNVTNSFIASFNTETRCYHFDTDGREKTSALNNLDN